VITRMPPNILRPGISDRSFNNESSKCADVVSARYIDTPARSACLKSAPLASAKEISAPRRFAPQKDAFTKRAPNKFMLHS
jgi:hypothetical protein